MLKQDDKVLSIFALGGVGEIGKNMYVVQYGEEIIVIDAGLKSPEAEMYGIDKVIPDISFLIENRSKVKAIIITHGHEDHIGGLSYFLNNINVPVYGSKLTIGLIQVKLAEEHLVDEATFHIIDSGSKLDLEFLKASFFGTNFSIPDSLGVVIDTPEGKVVHTGNFKFDQTPVDQQSFDFSTLSGLGKEGVLVLMSDSTNAAQPGFTGSEWEVGQAIERAFGQVSGRIIFATFATNIYRIQQLIHAAALYERKVALVGKSMQKVVRIAVELGYLDVPEGMLVEPQEIQKMDANQVVILVAGNQGEPISALNKIGRSTHRRVSILQGDTVMIAATPISGDERYVGRVIDQLYRKGAEVIYGPEIHVSGHGSQEELKLMLNLTKPKYFIPMHGEYRMQKAHADIAKQVGMVPEDIFLLNNGDTVEITEQQARLGGRVQSGQVLIDGLGVGDVGNIVLRDRKSLSQDGILIVIVTLCRRTGQILSGPNIISRGFVYVRESEELLEEANQLVSKTLEQCAAEKLKEWSSLKTSIRDVLGRFLYDKIRRRPMILPIIMEA